ncbi:MAG: tetratricopeptide repeat protein, partial [Burkholderiales bacterium]|nr:tetratricopeptide repeat protein [Burkholderiales bacterium]
MLLIAGCGGSAPPDLLASAKDYLAKKDPKAAIIQLKSALQQDAQSGEARYLLGKALLQTGDAAGAEAQLGKAEELHYAPEQVAPARARALLQLGAFARLTDAYGALKLQDKAAAADLETSVAGAYLMRGQRDAAAQALDQALAAQPAYEPALLLQARIAAAKPDFPAALALVEKITAANPASAEAWMLQGQLQQFGLHDSAAALASYRKALALRNDLMAAHQAVVSLLLQAHDVDGASAHVQALAKTLPHQPVTQFLQAQMAYVQRDFAGAARLMQPLVQAAPNNALFLQLAGAAAYQTNSMTQARTLLAQAVKLAPGLPLATQLLAQASLRSGEPDRALEVLHAVIADPAAAAAGSGEFYT